MPVPASAMSKRKASSGRPNPGISDLLTGGGALGGPRRASAAPTAFLPAELENYEWNGNRAIHKYNAHRLDKMIQVHLSTS
ncbi:DNA polymerase beta-like [Aythya fuligula]|uniref:DNA polymerase beta-like n=1 Tax=Aythya fuligula TaxID=219594 RepID=A0A6J3EM82_AYTFU|nr:DNA polymerase beta-like [Aythya fuligula]